MTEATQKMEIYRGFGKIAVMDTVILCLALFLLAVFATMPWMIVVDKTYTGLEILSGVETRRAYTIPEAEHILVVGSGTIALALVSMSGVLGKFRRITDLGVMGLGMVGMYYYGHVFAVRGQAIDDVREVVGNGFYVGAVISLLLIIQVFFSRKLVWSQLDRPRREDGTRESYFTVLRTILTDDMFQRNTIWLLMTLPAVIWLFVFKYATMYGLITAFVDYKPRRGIEGSRYIGLDNFDFLLNGPTARRAAENTLMLNLLFIFAGTIFALFVAALLFEVYTSIFTRFYQTALLLPTFISWVIASYFVFALLKTDNGLVNTALDNMGVEPVRWYASPQYWPYILLMAHIWNSVGFGSLIYLAGMLGIDPHLYEAARIDGAGKWKQYLYITFPLLLPLVVINVLLALGHVFNADFGLFYQVTRNQAALYETTDVLDTFIYRSLISSPIGVRLAAAAQVYQSLVGFALVVAANWIVKRLSSRKGREDMSLF